MTPSKSQWRILVEKGYQVFCDNRKNQVKFNSQAAAVKFAKRLRNMNGCYARAVRVTSPGIDYWGLVMFKDRTPFYPVSGGVKYRR